MLLGCAAATAAEPVRPDGLGANPRPKGQGLGPAPHAYLLPLLGAHPRPRGQGLGAGARARAQELWARGVWGSDLVARVVVVVVAMLLLLLAAGVCGRAACKR